MDTWQAAKFLEKLGNVPVDNDGRLDEDWMGWPKGTDREDIWHWIEDRCPGFSVAHAMGLTESKP